MLYMVLISLSLLIAVFFIVVLTRSFIHWKSHIPTALYAKALRAENDGHFEEAIANYEIVLSKCRRVRFQRAFKIKIIGKVKLLHTIVDYNNSFRFVR